MIEVARPILSISKGSSADQNAKEAARLLKLFAVLTNSEETNSGESRAADIKIIEFGEQCLFRVSRERSGSALCFAAFPESITINAEGKPVPPQHIGEKDNIYCIIGNGREAFNLLVGAWGKSGCYGPVSISIPPDQSCLSDVWPLLVKIFQNSNVDLDVDLRGAWRMLQQKYEDRTFPVSHDNNNLKNGFFSSLFRGFRKGR